MALPGMVAPRIRQQVWPMMTVSRLPSLTLRRVPLVLVVL
jgi:hypothetical protein